MSTEKKIVVCFFEILVIYYKITQRHSSEDYRRLLHLCVNILENIHLNYILHKILLT